VNYVVTGASGFVGRHLAELLTKGGHTVQSFVRRAGSAPEGTTEHVIDLLDRRKTAEAIASAQPDGIFHLAAPETSAGHSWEDPARTIDENLETAMSVLDAAREAKPRVMLVSSMEAKSPVNPYALSKKFSEDVAEIYRNKPFEVPVLVVRPSNHIGPGQSTDFVVPAFAAQIAEIEQTGSGEIIHGNLTAQKDFSDVRDMVKAYLLLMEQGEPGQVYEIGSGTTRTVEALLKLLMSLSTANIETVADKARFRPVETAIPSLDLAPISALGWKPQITLEDTLSDMLEYERKKLTKGS
jgi:GDP-4-dehydro-6-deoxy-D-mannose reductase